MSDVDILKSKLNRLVDDFNESSLIIKLAFNQQSKVLENMSISGANGRLWVQPSSIGYDISLSGKSLESNYYNSMKAIFGRDCDGYKQTNRNTGNITQPFWRADCFRLVQEAFEMYSKTA